MSQNTIKCEEGKQYITASGYLTTNLTRVADDYYKGYITSPNCISSLIWADNGTVIRIGEAIPSPKTKKHFQLIGEYMKEDVISLHEKLPGSLLGCRQCSKQVTDLIGGCCGIECHSKKWNIHYGTPEYEKYRQAFLDVFQYNEEVKAEKFNLPSNNKTIEVLDNGKRVFKPTFPNRTLHTTFTREDIEVNKEPVKSSFVELGAKDEEIVGQGGMKFETGAVRSSDKVGVAWHLITPEGLRRIAETYKEGETKYGAFNWERGMPIGDLLNHAIDHIFTYLAGEPSGEDDLAHAAWNLLAAMHMEKHHPEINHQLRPDHPVNRNLMP